MPQITLPGISLQTLRKSLPPPDLRAMLTGAGANAALLEIHAGERAAATLLACADHVDGLDPNLSDRLRAHGFFVQRKFALAEAGFARADRRGTLIAADALIWARVAQATGRYDTAKARTDLAIPDAATRPPALLGQAAALCALDRPRDALALLEDSCWHSPAQGDRPLKRKRDWMRAYLHGILTPDMAEEIPYAAPLIDRYRGRAGAQGADLLLGVLDFKSLEFRQSSMNIGDTVQTLTLMRHLARRFGDATSFDDPDLAPVWDDLRATWGEDLRADPERRAHVAIVDRDTAWASGHVHAHRKIFTIFHGWLSHRTFDQPEGPFPLPGHIAPVILSIYVQRPEDLTQAGLEYLRAHAPIGCRDWSTVYWLLNRGCPAFFSGCITMTMALPGTPPNDTDFAVDMPGDAAPGVTHVAQNEPVYRTLAFGAAARTALDLLRGYVGARSVATTRLHCYLPTRAAGGPVAFHPPAPHDRRFDGLDDAGAMTHKAIRARLMGLLDGVLDRVAAGETESQIRAAWQDMTAPLVKEARARLNAGPPLLTGPETPEDPVADMGDGPVQVALSFDNNLVERVPPLIRSILANTLGTLHFTVMVRGVPKDRQKALAHAFPQAAFTFHDMQDRLDGAQIRLAAGTTISTMDRLFLPQLCPDLDRIVYLDIDVTLRGDIADLARTAPSRRGIAAHAVPNPHNPRHIHWIERTIRHGDFDARTARDFRRATAAAYDLWTPYLNAGVLVLSLKRLRQLDFTAQTRALVETYGLEDQEAINLFSLGDYTEIGSDWNAQPYSAPTDTAKLLHWPGALKPWLRGRPILLAEDWARYDETPAAGDHNAPAAGDHNAPAAGDDTPATTTPTPNEAPAPAPEPAPVIDWTDPGSYHRSWDARAAMAAKWFPVSGRVADIGCGAPMALRGFLAGAVSYHPADITAWTPEVTVIDLDKNEFPKGTFDSVALLGVIEYLQKPGWVFRQARRASPEMVVSYCHPAGRDSQPLRAERNWINAFAEPGLERLLNRNGWQIADRAQFVENANIRQMIYRCTHCDPVA